MTRLISFVKNILVLLLVCYGVLVLAVTLFPFSFNEKNNCLPAEGGGIRFYSPAIMYTDSIPSALLTMRQFSIVFRFAAASESSSVSKTIITNSINSYDQNFSIRQVGTALVFRVSTGSQSEPIELYILNAVRSREPIWCSIVYDGDVLRSYINGKKICERGIRTIDCLTWDRSYPLVVGGEANGYHSWDGTLYSLSLYNKALSADAVLNLDRNVHRTDPLLYFSFDHAEKETIYSTGTDSFTVLHIPKNFIPVRRTILLESTKLLLKPRLYLRDIIGNIILFMPLGFLASLLTSTLITDRKKNILFVCGIALIFSLSIELLQVYIPGRFSSISDVLSNTIGAFLGVMIYFLLLNDMKTR